MSNARRRRRRGKSENQLGAKTNGAGATAPSQPGGAVHGHLRDDDNGRGGMLFMFFMFLCLPYGPPYMPTEIVINHNLSINNLHT